MVSDFCFETSYKPVQKKASIKLGNVHNKGKSEQQQT